jgi:hypothetical protein
MVDFMTKPPVYFRYNRKREAICPRQLDTGREITVKARDGGQNRKKRRGIIVTPRAIRRQTKSVYNFSASGNGQALRPDVSSLNQRDEVTYE